MRVVRCVINSMKEQGHICYELARFGSTPVNRAGTHLFGRRVYAELIRTIAVQHAHPVTNACVTRHEQVHHACVRVRVSAYGMSLECAAPVPCTNMHAANQLNEKTVYALKNPFTHPINQVSETWSAMLSGWC